MSIYGGLFFSAFGQSEKSKDEEFSKRTKTIS